MPTAPPGTASGAQGAPAAALLLRHLLRFGRGLNPPPAASFVPPEPDQQQRRRKVSRWGKMSPAC